MEKTVHRSARIALSTTPAQRRRCLALMVSAGDVWAMVIDCNRALLSWGLRPIVAFSPLCRELTGMSFGELARLCAEDVLKRYSHSWFEAAKRRAKGERAGFPRRKRRLYPVRFRMGQFALDGRGVRLATARGRPPLRVRLARDIPYDRDRIRSVTLVYDAGRLLLDVTAAVSVEDHGLDPGRIAGVDVGIIHPFAVAGPDDALVVSGRALRAEERLHLEDTKRRAQKIGSRQPSRGERGSRRYKRLRARQRTQEARHRRRIRQAHHEAAKQIVSWALARRIGTLVIGAATGITQKDAGTRHNLRLRQWRRTHLLQALTDKAELAGMMVQIVDERGSSSTCPECRARVTKPKGRMFFCKSCSYRGHRDVVGARNIAAFGGGTTGAHAHVMHRRAGSPPARRDRRRHLYDLRRSCPGPGRPRAHARRESLVDVRGEDLEPVI